MSDMNSFDDHNTLNLFQQDEIDILLDFVFPPAHVRQKEHIEDGIKDSVLITFLNACLSNLGWGHEDLAKHILTDVSLVDAIMNGNIPQTEIDEDLLADIAHAVGYEPSIFKIMAGYDDKPSQYLTELVEDIIHTVLDADDFEIEKRGIGLEAKELKALQKELASLLLQGIGGYSSLEDGDEKERILYERVISSIKSAMVNYETEIADAKKLITRIKQNYEIEIRAIRSMIEDLKTAQAFEKLMKDQDADNIFILQNRIIEIIEKAEINS